MSGSSPAAGVTPAMRQFFDAKRQYRDAVLFFRMGDFFEMFYEDALTAARALELTLTSRSKDAAGNAVPMCGVPLDRKSTRLNSSHSSISYAVFCLKKKNKTLT